MAVDPLEHDTSQAASHEIKDSVLHLMLDEMQYLNPAGEPGRVAI